MDFTKNNLAIAGSPYLRQHSDNPVWWQEWSDDVWAHAVEANKPVLVSIGYSTCHWCHVMAREAFSDAACAEILNERFVSIKVDREQRPDIDHYLMSFLVATTGSGGWPLNAFLTPDKRPFFAMTYAAAVPRFGAAPFPRILQQVSEYYGSRAEEIQRFELSHSLSNDAPQLSKDGVVVAHAAELHQTFDSVNGGFQGAQKFPPHSTLAYTLYGFAATDSDLLRQMITRTLDAMMDGGLHDHLQGGFFRYCVDAEWRIPHFEKMLYDQAMMLWNYSIAAKALRSEPYRRVAASVVRCLDESFADGDLYVSAHDADTEHVEGATYLWDQAEVERLLSPAEFAAFCDAYKITAAGNFEGHNHLIRSTPRGGATGDSRAAGGGATVGSNSPPGAGSSSDIVAAESKLLEARRSRPRPAVDRKIIVSTNALTGLALVAAERHAGIEGASDYSERIAATLLGDFVLGDESDGSRRLAHAKFDGKLQDNQFLGDTAALLLLLSFLDEDGGDRVRSAGWLERSLLSFQRDGVWFDALNRDFQPVPADPFDSPAPSGISMAELFLARQEVLTGDYQPRPYASPLASPFLNIAAMMTGGEFYVVESPQQIDWRRMPANTIRVAGPRITTCFHGVCQSGLPPVA